jgi:LacI family transcriptional regulator
LFKNPSSLFGFNGQYFKFNKSNFIPTAIEKDNSKSGIKLIAQLANVSIGTVDRVLHNRPGVAEETRKKVLKVIEELNYKPNIIARRLVSKKKYTFAVLIPNPTQENPYWNLHLPGVNKAEQEIKELGVFIEKLPFDQNDVNSFIKQSQKIMSGGYDGLLFVPFFKNESLALAEDCSKKNIPFVYFDTNLHSEKYFPLTYVGQDAFKSGYFAGKLASYLLNEGEAVMSVSIHEVKPSDNHVNFIQREEGLKNFIQDHSKKIRLISFNYNSFEQKNDLESEFLECLEKTPSVKVVFVTNSRGYKIASILEKNNIRNRRIIGYDLIRPNIEYLKTGLIDFLISQEPVNQTYQGIMSLFNKLILNQEIEKEKWQPINLILKENLDFFQG